MQGQTPKQPQQPVTLAQLLEQLCNLKHSRSLSRVTFKMADGLPVLSFIAEPQGDGSIIVTVSDAVETARELEVETDATRSLQAALNALDTPATAPATDQPAIATPAMLRAVLAAIQTQWGKLPPATTDEEAEGSQRSHDSAVNTIRAMIDEATDPTPANAPALEDPYDEDRASDTMLSNNSYDDYDALEVQGVSADPDDANIVEVDNENPQFFSLYAHYKPTDEFNGVICLGDFHTRAEALREAHKLAARLDYPVNDYTNPAKG